MPNKKDPGSSLLSPSIDLDEEASKFSISKQKSVRFTTSSLSDKEITMLDVEAEEITMMDVEALENQDSFSPYSQSPNAGLLKALGNMQSNANRLNKTATEAVEDDDIKHVIRYMKPMKKELKQIMRMQQSALDSIQWYLKVFFGLGMIYVGKLIFADEKVYKGFFGLSQLCGTYCIYIMIAFFLLFRFVVACYYCFTLLLAMALMRRPDIVIPLFILYISYYYYNWTKEFGSRSFRSESACPSNHPRPRMQGIDYKNRDDRSTPFLSKMATYHGNAGNAKENLPNVDFKGESTLKNMDHLHIPLLEYLLMIVFVGPNSFFLMTCGNIYWRVRQLLIYLRIVSEVPCDYDQTIVYLVLNTSICRNFTTLETIKGKEVATFDIPEFWIILSGNNKKKVKILRVVLNLTDKKVVSAHLMFDKKKKEKVASLKDLLCLIYYHDISATHVQAHSFANWGTDNQCPDAFVRRLSNLTILYNYFGATVFIKLTKMLSWLFIIPRSWDVWLKQVDIGLKCPIVKHDHIRSLQKYSNWINFVVQLRNPFLTLFNEYSDGGSFGRVDGEALFVGSVIHSLDHLGLELSIKETMWFQVDTKEYEPMMWYCRIVRGGFVDDIPGICFDYKYKHASHGFFNKVYMKAREIELKMYSGELLNPDGNSNPFYAENIDGCILK